MSVAGDDTAPRRGVARAGDSHQALQRCCVVPAATTLRRATTWDYKRVNWETLPLKPHSHLGGGLKGWGLGFSGSGGRLRPSEPFGNPK